MNALDRATKKYPALLIPIVIAAGWAGGYIGIGIVYLVVWGTKK